MSTAREQRVVKILTDAPSSARGILERAYNGTGGRTNAIQAMCLACMGFDRDAVRNCSGWSCPLWKYRPFQSSAETGQKTGVADEQKAAL